MPANLILNTSDLKSGRVLTIELDGEEMTGVIVASGISASLNRVAMVKWEDGALGRITDGFLLECSRVSIDFNGRFN